LKTVAYVRVSTEEQSQRGVSLAAQREKITAYASLYGLELVTTIEDAGLSGKSLDRPGLQKALAMLRRREVDALVVMKLDRLTRSVRDLGALIEDQFSGRTALLSVSEQIDTRSAAGRLVLNILGSVAQWEREAIGERTASALRFKRDRREAYNHAPLGFDRVGSRLIINETEQLIVRRIRDLRRDGLSLRGIAEQLELEGCRSKTGRPFSPKVIRDVLMNPIHQAAA
jgi:site-specific DNA recombinase